MSNPDFEGDLSLAMPTILVTAAQVGLQEIYFTSGGAGWIVI